jgi:recombination protein RecR
MSIFAESIDNLIHELSKLPGIGQKTATRLSLYIIRISKENAYKLTESIKKVKEEITLCSTCYNLTDKNPCNICSNSRRQNDVICVVEESGDLISIEKTKQFNGKYHVLHGVLSPLNNIGPEDLKINELIVRLKKGETKEVIIATNPNAEGEATALYLANLIQPMGIKVTRIAQGIPTGGDIEYVDQVTLTKSLKGRIEI